MRNYFHVSTYVIETRFIDLNKSQIISDSLKMYKKRFIDNVL